MSPDYPRALRANLWKLYLIQTCRWFLLLMPVLVLFYQENGLDLQDVFIVQAFFSVCIIVFEVPSGYFADRLGRRQSMLIGTISAAIGFGFYAFSDTLPEILCAQFFIAIGGSFISGSDTALLYDTLIELKQADQYQRIAGRLGSIGNFSEGIAGLLGGLLALLSLRTPLYYQAALMLVAIPLAWSLTEPERHTGERGESTFKAILAIVRYALHGHAEIKWLILYSSLVGNSTLTIVWLVQPYLQAVDPLGVLRRRLGRTAILGGPFRHQRLSDRKLTRTPLRTGLTNLALLRRLSATEPIPGAMGHRISLHFLSRQGDQRPGPQRLYQPLCQLGYPRHSIIGQKLGRSSDVCIVGAASRLDQ